MLGKLIKYDMKALNRFLILIHGFLLFAALLVRFFLTGRVLVETPKDGTLLGLSFLLFFLIIMSVSFGTFIVIAVRFYKNLFSDEGYLTRTLPVTSGQHLLSKTIAGSIWASLDMILLLASFYIISATPFVVDAFNSNKDLILRELGGDWQICRCLYGRYYSRDDFLPGHQRHHQRNHDLCFHYTRAAILRPSYPWSRGFLFCSYHGRIRHILCRHGNLWIVLGYVPDRKQFRPAGRL